MTDEPIEFEMKRVPVSFFTIGPEPERTIREKYEREALFGMHSVGGPKQVLMGMIRLVQDTVGGLADAHWRPPHKVGADETAHLYDVPWEIREHIRGAVLKFLARLNHIDRDDAMELQGRHEGHHHHVKALSLFCSCDDNVILTYWSGIPARHPNKLTCTECGKEGMSLSASPISPERP